VSAVVVESTLPLGKATDFVTRDYSVGAGKLPDNSRTRKKFEIQLALGTSGSQILLALGKS